MDAWAMVGIYTCICISHCSAAFSAQR